MSRYFIWGMGFLGTSLARDLKNLGYEVGGCVLFEKQKKFIKENFNFENIFLVEEKEQIVEFLKNTNLVCIATPVSVTAEILKELSQMTLPAELIVTDMGSTKAEIMSVAYKDFPQLKFTGSHPMAGSELSGPENSKEGLFQGVTVFITPGLYPEANSYVQNFWHGLGSHAIFINEKEHDKQLAYLSHGLHLLACAVAYALEDVPSVFSLPYPPAGGSFRDMTRVAMSNPKLWDAIIHSNRKEIVHYLEKIESLLNNWRKALEQQQLDVVSIFQTAQKLRQKILPTLYE